MQEQCKEEDFLDLKDGILIPSLDEEFVALWNQYVGIAPKLLYDLFSQNLSDFKLSISLYPTGTGNITLWSAQRLFAEMQVDLVEKTLHLSELRIAPQEQGHGLSRSLFRNLLSVTETLHLNKLTTFATEGGGYAFARMGFLPTQEAWLSLREQIRAKLDSAPCGRIMRDHILKLLESEDPRTAWEIADLPTEEEWLQKRTSPSL